MTKRTRGILQMVPLLLGLAVAGCSPKSGPAPDPRTLPAKAVPVTVVDAETRSIERVVDVTGDLKGWEDVKVGAKRMGRVVRVLHDIGDRVKPGELLLELETTDSDLAVAQALRSVEMQLQQLGLKVLPRDGGFDESTVPSVVQAHYAHEKALKNFNREKMLRQRGSGTDQDYQNAEIDELSARAAWEHARNSTRVNLANALMMNVAYELARQQRRDMELRAPVPSKGTASPDAPPPIYAVTKRSASEGQMLKEGDTVADLVIENPLRLWTNVPEKYAGDVAVGQPVRVTVPAYPGRTFVGKVIRINPSIDMSSRTFQVQTLIPNDDGRLHPGGFAHASIVLKQSDPALTVPIAAIVRSVGVIKLFVVDANSKAHEVHVELGREEKGWVEVMGAIPSRAKVIETGQSQLAEGVPVIVRSPEPSAPTAKPASEASSSPAPGRAG